MGWGGAVCYSGMELLPSIQRTLGSIPSEKEKEEKEEGRGGGGGGRRGGRGGGEAAAFKSEKWTLPHSK